jgi:hypothetical protein
METIVTQYTKTIKCFLCRKNVEQYIVEQLQPGVNDAWNA